MDKIISLKDREWLERQELAQRLNVSPRTLTAMIHRKEVERRKDSGRILYRYCGPPLTPAETKEPPPNTTSPKDLTPTKFVAVHLADWTTSRETLASLQTELQASREDVRRAVAYAQELEDEADRLADQSNENRRQNAQIRAQLHEEKGRRLELEEQFQSLLGQFEESTSLRARYHLERARRQQSDEENTALKKELHELKSLVEKLDEALEDAKSKGFKAELGPLTVEIKR